jgi:putative OPT family oligopeptide transporter
VKPEDEEKLGGIPENAYRELKEGEKYEPVMSPDKQYKEVTPWSVTWGIIMAVIFSAAAAYLGLKVGQVFEAAIPIAIIAVGLSSATKRKGALGENVIIQSIGASSGVIVAGAIFTLPALYILQVKYPEITVNFIQVFMSSLLGGILGILFLIPFRKYFVSDMHGKYPFPEATATTQVLVSGESSGQAKPLIFAGLIGGLYDFVIATFGAWSETFTSRILPWGAEIADKAKVVFKVNVGAAVLGLGYIVGLKYAAIICAGSILVWFIIVPLFPFLSESFLLVLNPTFEGSISGMPAEDIFKTFGRHIGIGGIAMAGIIGIIKSWGIVKSAVGLAAKELGGKKADAQVKDKRTQVDIPMRIISIGVIIALIATFIFFYLGVIDNLLYALVGIVVVAVIAFLFTTVAANAIAIVGSNPVSGMTLMTLILASLVMVAVGLSGTSGMVTALIMGGVVCTALSMAGGFITDLKVGYWLGSTPKKQESWKFLGTLVSAVTVGGVIMILNKTYGFVGENALVAPQANAMAAVIDPLMTGAGAPWILYGIGALIAILLTFFKVPALAFALGMFIPLELNIPLLIGGAINWYVGSRSKDEALNKARVEKGTLLASGFIAGGALMGVVSAAIKFGGGDLMIQTGTTPQGNPIHWGETAGAGYLALFMYVLIIIYMIYSSLKAKKEGV